MIMIMMILQDVFPLQRWSWSHWRLHRHRLYAGEDEAGHQRLATYDHFRQHHQCDYFRRELSPT